MTTNRTQFDHPDGFDEAPKIWIFVLALSIGGAERTIVDLVNGLDRERFDVEVWTLFDTNPLAAELEDDIVHNSLGVEAEHGEDPYEITGATNPLMYLLAPLQFVSAVRRERPDIVHSFLFYGNQICRIVGLASPQTTVITGERGFHNASRPVMHALDRITLPLSDTIVSNSQSGADYYEKCGVAPDNLRVIPNGRNLHEYRNASSNFTREEFDIPPTSAVVGTVGRLVHRKGHADLLSAWSRVDESFPDAHLLIIGDGPDRNKLESMVADLDLDSRVHFTGMREDVPQLLDSFDVFVFPSHWEGLPGALLEAMAAGLPIVATRVTGNVELISHQESGLLVPPKEPDALAATIERVLSDPEFASWLGKQAQIQAFDNYTSRTMVEQFEEVYNDLTRSTLTQG